MKRRVKAYFLSAATVYITMSYLTKMFMDILYNFSTGFG